MAEVKLTRAQQAVVENRGGAPIKITIRQKGDKEEI